MTKLRLCLFALACLLGLVPLAADAANPVVRITVSTDSCQKVTGFGAAAMGTLMCPITDDRLIDMAYGEDSPIGLNILRMEVSPNTIGDVKYEYWDPIYDWKGYVKAVKMARSKGAIILGTPWSPPAVYKTNNSSSGGKNDDDPSQSVQGKLTADGYKKFFTWLNTFVVYMKNQGAPVDVVAIQNEPDFWVSYSGCLYTPDEMHDLVANYGSRFSKANGVRLLGGESFCFNPEYTNKLLDDEKTRNLIDIIGGHIYGSKPLGNMKTACDKATLYGKETWMTEHTVDPLGDEQKIYDVPRWQDELVFAEELNESMLAGISGYIYWYLYQRFGMIGDGESVPSGGNKKDEILPRGYVMSHFAKHLPGAWRVKTTSNYISDTGSFERSAYMKGDSLIIIAINMLAKDIDLKLQTPYEVTSCKHISSTSLTSLCNVTDVPVAEPTRELKVTISGQSVNTFIMKMKDAPTSAQQVQASDAAASKSTSPVVYNLHGQRVTQMQAGQIYIVDGKKVVARQE